MEDVQYIMVTKWKGHWDKFWSPIPNAQSTLFTHGAIGIASLRSGPWPVRARTLFIKLDENNQFERSWIGDSTNFRPDIFQDRNGNRKPAVRFEVENLEGYECPAAARAYGNGWHQNPNYSAKQASATHTSNNHPHAAKFTPAFFNEMGTCDWPTFESDCYYLLKLLGIHEIHQYPQGNNQGKADGFFRFGTLSVLYDATLNGDLSVKNVQIANYASQLSSGTIQIDKHTYTMDGVKQVWIITRSNKTQVIGNINNVAIKEVPYTTLIDMYKERLEKNWGSRELFNRLNDIK